MRTGSIYYFSIKSDKKLHEEMIKKVGNAPINLYFDVTPIGRVLNKFSSDLNDLSNMFGMMFGAELAMFYSLLKVVIVAAVALIYFTLLFPLLVIVAFHIFG
jgi:ABC-type multidrug transport system fused ATPase/permease subunit